MASKHSDPTSAMLRIIAALDSPLRLSIIDLLAQDDHPVNELVSALGQSQPLVSQHLRVLKLAGIIDGHRSGRMVTYTLVDRGVIDIIEDLKALTGRVTSQDN